MRRLVIIVMAVMLILTGCGGSHHKTSQKRYRTPYGVSAHPPGFGVPPKGARLPRPLTGVPEILMLDTVDNTLHGFNPPAVAGYTSGFWPTYGPLAANYPRSYHIAVMVNAGHFGVRSAVRSCLDVEPGDATPAQAGTWDREELNAGIAPCNYASLSNMGEVKSNVVAAGVPLSAVCFWDANWTFVPHIDSGYCATQYTDHYGNQNIDGSMVTPQFLRINPHHGPSQAQKRGWGIARGKSLYQYHKHGCTLPVLGSGTCGQLAWRVNHYQVLLDKAGEHAPKCFGHRAEVRAHVCQIVRPAVAVRSRARKSTFKALGARGCESGQRRVRDRICDPLWQRYDHFNRVAVHSVITSRL